MAGDVEINLSNTLPTGTGGFDTTPKEVDVDITDVTSAGVLIKYASLFVGSVRCV